MPPLIPSTLGVTGAELKILGETSFGNGGGSLSDADDSAFGGGGGVGGLRFDSSDCFAAFAVDSSTAFGTSGALAFGASVGTDGEMMPGGIIGGIPGGIAGYRFTNPSGLVLTTTVPVCALSLPDLVVPEMIVPSARLVL